MKLLPPALAALVLLVALGAGGCATRDPSSAPAPSNVSATGDTAPLPPPEPATTEEEATPRSTAADPCEAADMASLETASRCLVAAVVAGDRDSASRFATPDTVVEAFGRRSVLATLRFESCSPPQRGEAQCLFLAGDDQLLTFTGGDFTEGGYVVVGLDERAMRGDQ